jgi:hypothetical protein
MYWFIITLFNNSVNRVHSVKVSNFTMISEYWIEKDVGETVAAWRQLLSQHFPALTVEEKEHLSHERPYLGRDLNPGYPQHESGWLPRLPLPLPTVVRCD